MRRLAVGVTGRTRIATSLITGKATTYIQTVHNYVYNHQNPPDIQTAIDLINNDIVGAGHDAYCDQITLVQGALTDTMQPSVWVAAASPTALFLDPFTIAAIVLIIKAVIPLLIVVTVYFIVTALKELIYGNPKQYYIPDPNITSPVSWEEYISYQNAHFWYVCSKDGAGFGDKSKYPNIGDVPQAEIDAYKDHCALAPDLSPEAGGLTDIITTIAIAGAIIGGLFLASSIIQKI